MCVCARTSVAKRPGSWRPEKTRSDCWSWTRTSRDNKRKSCTTCFLFQLFCRLLLYSSGDKMTLEGLESAWLGCVTNISDTLLVFLISSGAWTWYGHTFHSLACHLHVWPSCGVEGHIVPGKQWPFCWSQPHHWGTVMTSWKKVLAKITSFAFSCELPAVCECTTDKLCGEGQLFFVL